MNEERYVLARLKKWLVELERAKDTARFVTANDVLGKIAEIEADAVLGPDTPEPVTAHTLQDTFDKYWQALNDKEED